MAGADHSEQRSAGCSSIAREWPDIATLEGWLHEAANDADHPSQMLRRLLKCHQGYGRFIVEDSSLVEICHLVNHRIRSVLAQEDAGIAHPNSLLKTVCECIWRSAGVTLESMLDLHDDSERKPTSARASLMAAKGMSAHSPEERSGQLKMLMSTNQELNEKLAETRSQYLQELTTLRDQIRILDPSAEQALQELHDEPVMFYEPLDAVLDETTKEFVRNVVDERLKLLMLKGWRQVGSDNDEVANMIHELERQLELERERNKELVRIGADKANRTKLIRNDKALWQLESEMDELEAEAERRVESSEALALRLRELECEAESQQERIFSLGVSESHAESLVSEMDELQKWRLSEVTESQTAQQWQMRAHKLHMMHLMQEMHQVQNRPAEVVKEVEVREVIKEDPQSEALRKKIAELEERLAETTKEDVSLKLHNAVLKTQIKEHQRSIEELKGEIHGLMIEKGAPRYRPAAPVFSDSDAALKQKYAQLEAEHVELQKRYADLEDKIAQLIKKLQSMGCGDAEIESVCKELGLKIPHRKKKKNVFERMYDDAMERQKRMQERVNAVRRLEEESLAVARSVVRKGDVRTKRQVEMLHHLAAASSSANMRFQEAHYTFVQQNVPRMQKQMRNADPTAFSQVTAADDTRIAEIAGEEEEYEQRPPPSRGGFDSAALPVEYGSRRLIKSGGQPRGSLPPSGHMWMVQDRGAPPNSCSMPALPRPKPTSPALVDHRPRSQAGLQVVQPRNIEMPDFNQTTTGRTMLGQRRSPRSPSPETSSDRNQSTGMFITPTMSYSGGPFWNPR